MYGFIFMSDVGNDGMFKFGLELDDGVERFGSVANFFGGEDP